MHSYARIVSATTNRGYLVRRTIAAGGLLSALLITKDEENKNEKKINSLFSALTTSLPLYDELRGATSCDFKAPNEIRVPRTLSQIELERTQKSLQKSYDVKWERPLGEGGFGAVYLGREKKSGDLGKNSSSVWKRF